MNHSLSRRMKILVMHPEPLVCAGLAAALQSSFEIFVHDTEGLPPDAPSIDVIIADYGYAMQLVDADVRRRCGALANARILALTGNDREADVRRAIEAGIHGYLLQGCSLEELAAGANAVARGVRYLCATVARRMADSVASVTLTLRENEVMRLVATGHSNKAIARQLDIGLCTVKSHVSAIMTKLGAKSRTQATSIAVTRGLVDERGPSPCPPWTLASRTPLLEPQPRFAWPAHPAR
jgi:DNA-binding NarL/FixJ family response regulator